MPCRSDYSEPSGLELESKRVCESLIYLYGRLNKEIPSWIKKTYEDYFGNTERLDEATTLLCSACRNLTEQEQELFIYDGHNKGARRLASWFDRHQEWDKRRVKEEEKTRSKIIAQQRALKKLTVEDMEALDLILDDEEKE